MTDKIGLVEKTNDAKNQNSFSQIRKNASVPSMNPTFDNIFFLQKTAGNQAVQRLLNSGSLQTKLSIGQPGDEYEQEADRVAEQIMSPALMPIIQRKCTGKKPCPLDDEKMVQRKTEQPAGASDEVREEVLKNMGTGMPMDNTTREFYESRFGHDFSQVRLHTDERAAESARGLNARAFTLGKDVAFGAGQYAPGTSNGRRLLAHELMHVVQQKNARLSAQTIQNKNAQKSNYIKDIYVNLTSQTVNWKYDDGTESDTYECSTGTGLCKSDCSSPNTSGSACTPVGSFKVCSRTTHAHYKYWIGFDCARAIAFHYYPDVDGCPWSHGCVRLHLEAVKLIYQGARKDYTMVHVSGTPKIRRCWTSSTAGTCRIRGTKKACKRNDCHELGDFPVPDLSEGANRFA